LPIEGSKKQWWDVGIQRMREAVRNSATLSMKFVQYVRELEMISGLRVKSVYYCHQLSLIPLRLALSKQSAKASTSICRLSPPHREAEMK
jgi:hypothetical protein